MRDCIDKLCRSSLRSDVCDITTEYKNRCVFLGYHGVTIHPLCTTVDVTMTTTAQNPETVTSPLNECNNFEYEIGVTLFCERLFFGPDAVFECNSKIDISVLYEGCIATLCRSNTRAKQCEVAMGYLDKCSILGYKAEALNKYCEGVPLVSQKTSSSNTETSSPSPNMYVTMTTTTMNTTDNTSKWSCGNNRQNTTYINTLCGSLFSRSQNCFQVYLTFILIEFYFLDRI